MLVVQNLVKQYGDFAAADDVSFEAGAASAIPNVAALLVGALVVTMLAISHFKYEYERFGSSGC